MSLYGAARAHNGLWVTVRQRLTVTLPPRDGYRTPYYDTVLQGRKWQSRKSEEGDVNRHICNILFDVGNVKNWSRVLRSIERVLNNSVKKLLGAAPNTLLLLLWKCSFSRPNITHPDRPGRGRR